MKANIYFDYDKFDIRSDQEHAAQSAAEFLAAHPQLKVTIEGHCDDRGSEEYNLALGDSRASALRNELAGSGAKSDQVKTISYGKEKPFCSQENEQCWQQNRRDHYILAGQ
jgi:peptidoglycan-associated lipoprotein